MVVLSELLRLSGASYSTRSQSGRWSLIERFEGRHGFVATLWSAPESNTAVLSVRGTKSVTDCMQDLRLLFGREPHAWREGREVLEAARERMGAACKLYLTGHSIGGAYASALGAESRIKTVTFNAPGMRDALRRSSAHGPWLEEDHNSVLNICTGSDFIWRLSGPGLSSRVLIVDGGVGIARRATGLRGVFEAWRRHSSRRGFVRESLHRHGLRSFSAHGGGATWERAVDSFFG